MNGVGIWYVGKGKEKKKKKKKRLTEERGCWFKVVIYVSHAAKNLGPTHEKIINNNWLRVCVCMCKVFAVARNKLLPFV